MRQHPKLSLFFRILTLLLSHAACAIVAYSYADMLCAIRHRGASAPVYVVFLAAIPLCAAILLCLGLACFFRRR